MRSPSSSSLHLGRIAEILDAELADADQNEFSYQELIARLFASAVASPAGDGACLAHQARRAARAMDAGVLVSQRQIRAFTELDFIAKAENILFIGPTGVGKTGLATGLLLKALQNGYRGLFLRAQDLFDEMYASLADRSTRKLLNRLARADVLVIDEMGYLNLRPEQTNIFFKLMEERYSQRPTIITTNLDWVRLFWNKHE